MLIDTPGFDDPERGDIQILTIVGTFLRRMNDDHMRLSGVLYLHRITDNKVTRGTLHTLSTVKKMCGDASSLDFMAMVMTHWDVVEPVTGEGRERQLRADNFWGTVLDKGGMMYRHYATPASAKRIVENMLPNPPILLEIQRELEADGIIGNTAAGSFLTEEGLKRVRLNEQKIMDLNVQIRQLQEKHWKSEREKRNLQEDLRAAKDNLAQVTSRNKQLKTDLEKIRMRVDDLERHGAIENREWADKFAALKGS